MNGFHRTPGFNGHVLTNNPQISHAIFNVTRNVIITQEEEFGGKVGRNGLEFAGAVVEADAAFFKKLVRILAQATGFL